MNPARRLGAIRAVMDTEGVEALVVAAPANVIYLTGFEGVFDEEPSAVCVITQDGAHVHVDSRYVEAASNAAESGPWSVVGPSPDAWESALAALDADRVEAFGLESSVPHARFVKVAKDREERVREVNGWVERMRVVKESEEIERIARAAKLADAAFEHVLGFVGAGRTESEIALELELFMRRNGSDGVAFPSIVAGGPNGSKPHARAGGRELEYGDLVTMDFGARVDGYCSDMTRTVAVGSIDAERRGIYDAVLSANEAGLAAVRAGRTGAEMDADARRVIEDAGFGEHFGHGLGHGVGIVVHEAPSVGPRGREPIPLGAVITVEPGVYVPGVGGARIEDLVTVGEDGPVVLSHAPKQLIEV